MPFVIFIAGLILFVAGIRGTWSQLFTLLKGDLTGTNNFLVWFAAIFMIGAIGYVPKLKPLSVALMGLVILRIALADGTGFFMNLKGIFSQTPTPDSSTNSASLLNQTPLPTTPQANGQPTGGAVLQPAPSVSQFMNWGTDF